MRTSTWLPDSMFAADRSCIPRLPLRSVLTEVTSEKCGLLRPSKADRIFSPGAPPSVRSSRSDPLPQGGPAFLCPLLGFSIRGGLEHAREDIEQLIDLFLLDDERRGERDDVAGGTHQKPAVERLDEARMCSPSGGIGGGLEFDGADQPDISDVDDVRQAFERMDRILPIGRKL